VDKHAVWNRTRELQVGGSARGRRSAMKTASPQPAAVVNAANQSGAAPGEYGSVVAMMEKGGYSEYVFVRTHPMMRIPPGLDAGEVVAVALNYLVAHQTLARIARIRRSSPALHRDRFHTEGNVLWWHPAGRPVAGPDWRDPGLHTLGLLLAGEWLVLLHAGDEAVSATLPAGGPLVPELDSTRPDGVPPSLRPLPGGTTITLPPRSLLLLRRNAMIAGIGT